MWWLKMSWFWLYSEAINRLLWLHKEVKMWLTVQNTYIFCTVNHIFTSLYDILSRRLSAQTGLISWNGVTDLLPYTTSNNPGRDPLKKHYENALNFGPALGQSLWSNLIIDRKKFSGSKTNIAGNLDSDSPDVPRHHWKPMLIYISHAETRQNVGGSRLCISGIWIFFRLWCCLAQ